MSFRYARGRCRASGISGSACRSWRFVGPRLPAPKSSQFFFFLWRARQDSSGQRWAGQRFRRGHAILVLLAQLGLPSSEVLSLEVVHIRWGTGEVLIRRKAGRQDLLLLPREVGAVFAGYQRLDRSIRPTRRVFSCTSQKVCRLGNSWVSAISNEGPWFRHGVSPPMHMAAEAFRYTLASRMLRQQADLGNNSEVFRRLTPSTTEIDAKIDTRSFQEIVRPWP